jgi:type II secretion system protein J
VKKAKDSGFTLLETLLALTLFTIVMISVYSVTTLGLQIWKRSREEGKTERKAILALEKMGQEIRSAAPYAKPKDEIALSKPQTFDFGGSEAAIMLPVIFNGDDPAILGGGGRVTYELNRSEGALCKKIETVSDLYLHSHKKCSAVAQGVSGLKFRYWMQAGVTKSYSWYDEWNGREGLPGAVEVTLTLKAKKNMPSRVFKKTVLISSGIPQ